MKDARKQIFAAILGLIILASSWIILNAINPQLVQLKEPDFASVAEEPEFEPPPPPPPAATETALFDILFEQIVDELITQERETLPKMKEFANLATQCSRDLCEGGTCEYWVSEPCPEEEDGDGEEERDWWNPKYWMLDPPIVYAQGDCGYWATCSAPCNTGDPCPSNKNELAAEVLAAADEMEEEISKLINTKQQIENCLKTEGTALLSCQDAIVFFLPEGDERPTAAWETVKDCQQGYDFYCAYGIEKAVVGVAEITFPLDTPKKSIESVRKLDNAVSSCNCSDASFCCECCDACSGDPCPSGTKNAAREALDEVGKLETKINALETAASEISALSWSEDTITLTCSEANSWLRYIKERGCPRKEIFPCCPMDKETEETILSCRGADFFFCIAP